MKLRILNYGVTATHDALVNLHTFFDTISISDFDAFVYDPEAFSKLILQMGGVDSRTPQPMHVSVSDDGSDRAGVLLRHAWELKELVTKKGGLAIVLLRPNAPLLHIKKGGSADTFSPYYLIESLSAQCDLLIRSLKPGRGSAIRINPVAGMPNYFRNLRTNLVFEAVLSSQSTKDSGTVYATNSVGDSAAFEIAFESGGRVLFAPIPVGLPGERVGAAIVETVRQRLQAGSSEAVPGWVEGVPVPRADEHTADISELQQQISKLEERLSALSAQRDELLKYRELLWSSGKFVLEPAVRRAFRLIGFDVKEPDTYDGEWDIDMTNPSGLPFVGEIEGPEGAVDVEKLRQLLDYHTEQVLSGSNPKALLIGNGFRSSEPGTRAPQFTEHVLNGAARYQIGLIPTTELFKAVCATLTNPDENAKREIRQSIQNCVGVWQFASSSPIPSAPSEPADELAR